MSKQTRHLPHQENPDYLLIGEILRPHGVRGELRTKILTDYPERISQLDTIFLGKSIASSKKKPYEITFMRMHKGYGLISLEGINSRDKAERLRGLFVMINIADAIPLDDDEIYLYQLIGLTVKTQSGQNLGTISEVLETGANDVYIINGDTYGEILIPVTEQTIIETNVDDGFILVSPPEGLLPDLST